MAHGLELRHVVDHQAPKEGSTIRQGGLVDDDLSTFCLNALHHTLDAALSEIVAIRLHRQAIDSDDAMSFLSGIVLPLIVVVIIPRFLQHLISDEILARTVAVDNGADKVFRHILVIGQKLFGVFGQTIATIAKTGIVVMIANTWIKTNAFYYR